MAVNIRFEARTDVGRERSENQDHYGSVRTDGFDFFIVCDGMGGHAGGSTASRLGVQTIEEHLHASEGDVRQRMQDAILAANHAIHQKATGERELRGMGTTVVVLGIDHAERKAYVSHVGDSRIYRLRAQEFRRLTRDHTMVQRLVDEGIISEEEAENHPNSNVISRSLGGQPEVEVEHSPEVFELEEGDIFLLCTDGLSGLITEREMAAIVDNQQLDDAADELISRANEEGGHDNITVELVQIGEHQPSGGEFKLVHPPRPQSAREKQAAKARVDTPATGPGKTGATMAIDITDAHQILQAAEFESGGEQPEYDEPDNRKLLALLSALTLILLVLVVVLLMRVARETADDETSDSEVEILEQNEAAADDEPAQDATGDAPSELGTTP